MSCFRDMKYEHNYDKRLKSLDWLSWKHDRTDSALDLSWPQLLVFSRLARHNRPFRAWTVFSRTMYQISTSRIILFCGEVAKIPKFSPSTNRNFSQGNPTVERGEEKLFIALREWLPTFLIPHPPTPFWTRPKWSSASLPQPPFRPLSHSTLFPYNVEKISH